MEPNTFDAIIKRACTTRLTRLETLRGLAVGAVAAVTGATIASTDAGAKKGKAKRKGKSKGKGKAGNKASSGQVRSVESGSVPATCNVTCTKPTTKQEPFPGGSPGASCFRIGDSTDDKFQLPSNGCVTYTDESCGCKTEFCVTPDSAGKPGVFSFHPKGDIGCTVSTVTVKGGNDQYVYTFDPASLCGEKLVAPLNNGGQQAAISHIDVCGVGCCRALKCKSDGGDVVCTDGPICNNCGGTITCPCNDSDLCTDDRCDVSVEKGICVYTPKCTETDGGCQIASCDPAVGNCSYTPKCTETDGGCQIASCTNGICSYTPKCPPKPGCTVSCVKGVCNEDCGCRSCTIGYYSQNQCRVNTSVDLPCPPTSAIGRKCYGTYGKTLKGLLTARGRDVICAQAAAAYLNSQLGTNNCTGSLNICSATNEQLSAANEGFGNETCPLRGCGNN